MQPPTGGGDGFVRKGERGSQRVGRCAGNHDNLRYCRDCSSLPGLNRTALPGGMATSAPVRGLRPMPVLRGRTLKMPKPRNSMRSPCDRARFMLSKTVSTAISALVLVIPVLFTTSFMMSSLITVSPSGAPKVGANLMIGLGLGSCQAATKDDRAGRARIAALSSPILGPVID